MQTGEIVALAIFASYFVTILSLFRIITKDVPIFAQGRSSRSVVFSGLVVASFAHTWYYMFAYLWWSYEDYHTRHSSTGPFSMRRLIDWLMNTGLFEQAWAVVSTRPMPWWWSEPICLYTVGALTIFVATNGRKLAVKNLWAYMVLGQLVAISVATNLFFLALSSTPHRKPEGVYGQRAPPILWFSVLGSLITVGLSPFTTEDTFLTNLLVLHALLVLPLLPVGYNIRSRFSVQTKTLYLLAAAMSLILRLRTTFAAFTGLSSRDQSVSGFLTVAMHTLHSHPAQSSIGWDVIWTTISLLFWILLTSGSRSASKERQASLFSPLVTSLTSFFLSPGVGAPLAFHEDVDEVRIAGS